MIDEGSGVVFTCEVGGYQRVPQEPAGRIHRLRNQAKANILVEAYELWGLDI